MQKTIWCCWFQGLATAPELVRKCVQSWRDFNPGWEVRCLDADTIARYVDLGAHVELAHQTITAASLSDILRVILLHEYGGVWVDATCLCNAPLDGWLGQAAQTGFFAFARPAADRELASWFLAAQPGNALLAKWAARALAYWQGREATKDYFWLHHQFAELIEIDPEAHAQWTATPQISADGPHSVQAAGLYDDYALARHHVDWSAPVFKLTHRLEEDRLEQHTLLGHILADHADVQQDPVSIAARPAAFASAQLCVGTENLGDHIQIIAGERMLAKLGISSTRFVDRDDEIANPPVDPTAILLNGWFKTNPAQWPPHPDFDPIYLGFHIRLSQSPSLIGPDALDHYRQHGPIGCRDRYTLSLLRRHGVDAFLSNCLTLCFPRRIPAPLQQSEVFVVSRDNRLLDYLPDSLGPTNFISHYSGSGDFVANMAQAEALLATYRDRARLIVTTMLHCALPAIAMGIPVVVFYPPNEAAARQSDRERFSSLADIVRVFELSEMDLVDWRGHCPDIGNIKLALIDSLADMATRWGALQTPRIIGWAPASALPVPGAMDDYDYCNDPERFARLAESKLPDRLKWGSHSSYRPEWAARGGLAAGFVADGETVLEIGAGIGSFRDLIVSRCPYTGTDLQPVDPAFLRLDLEKDPMPVGRWDVVVMLGVLEYIHDPAAALAKISATTPKLVMSYCCAIGDDYIDARRRRGWVSDLDEVELARQVTRSGFEIIDAVQFNDAKDFRQNIFLLRRTFRTAGTTSDVEPAAAGQAGA